MAPARPIAGAALAAMLSFSVAQPAAASVVTLGFDDIPNEFNTRAPIASGYAGFSWNVAWTAETYGYYNAVFTNTLSVGAGTANFQHVINLKAGATLGEATSFSSVTPFYLKGLTLTGFLSENAFKSFSARSVVVKGYSLNASGQLVEAAAMTVNLANPANGAPLPLTAFNPLSFSPDWASPVVEVRLTPSNGTNSSALFLLDNLQVQLVPLPASGLLLSGALASFALARRRTSSKRSA